ncbi:hypothetical protein [Brucella grignonensis]|uniref:hypothetical protein n=1 Tax=Brucella grignonensis TaxID=94627 RepID=UPI0011402818|nr:hypothetical protein [Brucella grignonensis]
MEHLFHGFFVLSTTRFDERKDNNYHQDGADDNASRASPEDAVIAADRPTKKSVKHEQENWRNAVDYSFIPMTYGKLD